MANEFKVKNGIISPALTNVANSDVSISASGTGRIKLNGLSWPAADGTNNYVLKTDGAGILSWAAQTGGGTGGTTAITVNTFTGTGSQTAFTLTSVPIDVNYTVVTINGITQRRTYSYTVSGSTLTFSEAPVNGSAIEVTILISGNLTGVAAGGTTGQVLTKVNATDYNTTWTTLSVGSGTVTSVSGTGTVNGLTLTGTVTASGSLTLGGTLDLSTAPAIGGTAAAAGSFTTLNASSTVSGTGFSTYLASPPAIGGTTAAAGRFTIVESTTTTGTAPFVVTSTTRVANLNVATAGAADSATTAGTVTTAAQTAITSVGTLTGLTVSAPVIIANSTISLGNIILTSMGMNLA